MYEPNYVPKESTAAEKIVFASHRSKLSELLLLMMTNKR